MNKRKYAHYIMEIISWLFIFTMAFYLHYHLNDYLNGLTYQWCMSKYYIGLHVQNVTEFNLSALP